MNTSKTLSLFVLLAVSPTLACTGSKADTATPAPAPAPEPAPEVEAKAPVAPIPEGYHALTPQLTVTGLDEAVTFYVKTLGAVKTVEMKGPDGKLMHAEVKIGDSFIMLDEENLENGMKSPTTLGDSPAGLLTYVDDVDVAFAALVDGGATPAMPPEDMFWGDRYASVVDPFGHRWSVATHLEDLTDEQMMQRAEIAFAPPPATKKGKKAKKAKTPAEPAWRAIEGAAATEKKPSQYHTVTVSLVVANAAEAIEFYKAAFGATEVSRMPGPDGKLMHAELKIGDSLLMLADEWPEAGQKSATTIGGSAVALHYYNEDVDAAFAQATGAGAVGVYPVTDAFWGDRYGAVIDSSGYMWGLATHIADLTEAEMMERMKAEQTEAKS